MYVLFPLETCSHDLKSARRAGWVKCGFPGSSFSLWRLVALKRLLLLHSRKWSIKSTVDRKGIFKIISAVGLVPSK